MSLKARLQQEMHEALRAREAGRERLSAIRMIRTAVLNAEKDHRSELDDAGVEAVLAREAKRLDNAIAEYRRLGQGHRAGGLELELSVIREFLPQPLSPDELTALVRQTIDELGATSPAELGKVMKPLMLKIAGRADGRAVSETVRRLLSPEG